MATEKFTNNAKTTLVGAITSGATTLVVASASSFPASPQFRLLIDSELMLVTAVSGTTFTVTRGAEGTSAASHADGSNVYGLFTAGALSQILTDFVSKSSWSSRPAVERAGKLFLPSDGYDIERDNASTWDAFGPLFPISPPVLANFTARNQGSATITQTGSGLYIATPSGQSSDNIHGWEIAAPAKPYNITAMVRPNLYAANFCSCGLYFTDGTKLATFAFAYDTGASLSAGPVVQATKWTNVTTFSAHYTNVARHSIHTEQLLFIRIHDDSTNRVCSYSSDGVNFTTFHSVATNDWLTPTNVGFFVNTVNSQICGMNLLSWAQS